VAAVVSTFWAAAYKRLPFQPFLLFENNAKPDNMNGCSHPPIPCSPRASDGHCRVKSLQDIWLNTTRSFNNKEHPFVVSLEREGCDAIRARVTHQNEGYGMTKAPRVLAAYRKMSAHQFIRLEFGVSCCDQCKPSTNTFAFSGEMYRGSCSVVPIRIKDHPSTSSDKVLCIGARGVLKWCGKDEFMAVSHVWEHGWQGDSERGLCSRVLDMLLSIAAPLGLKWVWLDVAMISGIQDIRIMSINSMNLVYSSAKVTLVCDRLLLSMCGGSD
jgi:hypothetical protein